MDLVEVRQVEVGEGGGAVDRCGMHDDVEMPEAVLDGVEHSGDGVLIGDICRERRAAPSLLRDFLDRRVGQVDASGVRHRDVEPVGGQLGGDDPAHAAGPPGHQGNPYTVSRVTICCHESSPFRGRSSAR